MNDETLRLLVVTPTMTSTMTMVTTYGSGLPFVDGAKNIRNTAISVCSMDKKTIDSSPPTTAISSADGHKLLPFPSTSSSSTSCCSCNGNDEEVGEMIVDVERNDGSDDNDNIDNDSNINTSKRNNQKFISENSDSRKSIGMIGSLSIAVNSLAGPAILQLPFQYQQSGIIPTTVCLIGVAFLSCMCCLHMANTVSRIPNNKGYDKCIEFSDPFCYFWSSTAYKVTQVLFLLTSVCMNVAAIVDTAEVVDSALGLQYISSYGISFFNHHHSTNNSSGTTITSSNNTIIEFHSWSHNDSITGRRSCTRNDVKLGYCTPYNDVEQYGNLLLTLGYLITAAVFVPICLKDLKENTGWQVFGFSVLITLTAYFCWCFGSALRIQDILDFNRVSLWGHSWGGMLGVIMFNFTLVLAIPAWLHEKKSSVSVRATVIQSTILSTILYIAVGILGALALPRVDVNMLSPMVSGAYGSGLQVAGSIFAFFIIGLDIPLFSVLARYNLTHSGMCDTTTANILVVYIPWCISWIFYQGDSIAKLLSWGGVLLTSAVAFILPLYLSLRAVRMSVGDDDDNDDNDIDIDNVNDDSNAIGLVNVSCNWFPFMSSKRQQQIKSLEVLLTIATGSVVVAIVGQLFSTKATQEYLHSSEYLNDTETFFKTTYEFLDLQMEYVMEDIILAHVKQSIV